MSAAEPPHVFGELRVERNDAGWMIYGPAAFAESPLVAPGELREWTRTDALSRYRPLTGARTLRPGWRCRVLSGRELRETLEAIYPLATAHREQWQEGRLRVVGLDEVLRRQTGRYEAAAALSAAGRRAATDALCPRCVRVPIWSGAALAADDIPCPEPCSVMVSLCREAALWEVDRPTPAPVDPAVPFAAFETPGNELREATLRAFDAGPAAARDSGDG